MTLDEAMTDLSIQLEVKRRTEQFRSADAIKLGIEAQRAFAILRSRLPLELQYLLPGETKEPVTHPGTE
jgi:hypothetical protein